MRPESYQTFAQLLEGFVNEASTSMDIISNHAGGKEVIQKLHKDMQLAHDIGYRPVDKISWSDLKGAYQGAWVIIQGAKGSGAIKASNGNYEAVASSGAEPRVVKDSRGGNVLDFLKGEIGKLQKFYVGKNNRSVSDKQRKRADAQKGTSNEVSQETLIKKFKPLWARAITASIADIKGHVANMIKNDSFSKAQKKLSYIESLQNALEQLEAGTDMDTPGFIRSAINSAVLMSAAHYYPETTGNIERSRYSSGLNAQHHEGPAQLLKDIAAGDQKKLGTVLSFFKRSLISG